MADVFIYSGLGILLLGAVYGLCIAVKGYRDGRKRGESNLSLFFGFNFGSATPQMRRLTVIWGIISIIGFIVLVIGLATGLN